MTVTTVDHVPPPPDSRTTATASRLVPPDVRHARDSEEAHADDTARVHALTEAEQSRPAPDLGATARYAELLYRITGWETFAYAALAASETPEEAEEHRRILRRRRPSWADED